MPTGPFYLTVMSCADTSRDKSATSKRHLDWFTAQPRIQTDRQTDRWTVRQRESYVKTSVTVACICAATQRGFIIVELTFRVRVRVRVIGNSIGHSTLSCGTRGLDFSWVTDNSNSNWKSQLDEVWNSNTTKVWTQSGLPGGSTGDVGCVLCCAGRWYSQQHISCTSTTHTSVTTRSRACSGRPVASTLAMCSTVTYHQHATPPQDCHQSCSLDTASPARRTRHASISTDQTTSSASRLILSSCTLLVSDLPFSACCLFLWFGRMLVAACKYLCFLESAFPKAQTSVLFQFAFLLRAPGKVKEQLCKELVVR